MDTFFYNIHSIVKISVTGLPQILHEVDLHLKRFRCEKVENPPDVVIAPYSQAPSTRRFTVVDDYDYGDGVYHRAPARFRMDMGGEQHVYHMDSLWLPINLIVQIALQRKGYTFVHGAGLNIDGKNVLFPAYPGTGKTTIVSAMVRNGARLFGDDLIIVGKGKMYSYPQAFSVYQHHLPILGYSDEKIAQIFRRRSLVERILNIIPLKNSLPYRALRLALYRLAPLSVNLDPGQIFGEQSIAQSGLSGSVMILERSAEVNALVSEVVDVSTMAEQASVVLWHEWHAYFHHIFLYDAMDSYGKGTLERFQFVRNLIEDEFKDQKCLRIRIPASWDNHTLVGKFSNFWATLNP